MTNQQIVFSCPGSEFTHDLGELGIAGFFMEFTQALEARVATLEQDIFFSARFLSDHELL